MELNQNTTPVPEVSTTSAAESVSNEDKELQEEMAQWKQWLVTLKNNENYEDKVTDAEYYLRCCLHHGEYGYDTV